MQPPTDTVLKAGIDDLVTSTEQSDEDGDNLYSSQFDVDQDDDIDGLEYVADDERNLVYSWSEATEVNMMVILDRTESSALYLCDLDDDLVLGCSAPVSCEHQSAVGPTRCFVPPSMPVSCGLCRQVTQGGDLVIWTCEDTSEFFFSF